MNFEDYGDLYDDPGDASAPAGSIVVYRPDVYHRSVDFTDPDPGALHAPRRRTSPPPWNGAATRRGRSRASPMEWHNFVQQATPRQLTALGSPHRATASGPTRRSAGVAGRYPGLDLGPWRAAWPPTR